MCLKQFPFYYGIFMTMVMVVQAQVNQSPCPETFQYEMDQNGQVYGTIKVNNSHDENVMEVNVEFSVGHNVNVPNNDNGAIELVTPRDQVLSTIQDERPLSYKVIFPRWENEPPKITRISVNGQVVCTGPPLQTSTWIPAVTTISLQHMWKIQYLQSSSNSTGNLFL